MPIDRPILEALARAYVAPMTSIRGRRVHRLLMRVFATFDHVIPARCEDGAPALVALRADGRLAACRTDGRGAAADVVECPRFAEAAVTTSHDLLKDSLPILRWTIRHAGLAAVTGALTIEAGDVAPEDLARVDAALRGGPPPR